MNRFLPLLLVALLAACAPKTQYLVSAETSALRLRPNVGSVLVATVSLPGYAAADDVSVQVADGTVVSQKRALWADQPERATTLALARHLGAILGVTVAPEPWPLEGFADATVDVRVEEMLARSDGQFRLSGLYFVRVESGGSNRSGRFDILVPMASAALPDVADAQAAAVLELAEEIARTLGR